MSRTSGQSGIIRRGGSDARFLQLTGANLAKTRKELEDLANEEPAMETAKQALEELSSDPQAHMIARDRELAVWNMQHMLHASREEGREEAKGALMVAIDAMCFSFGIELEREKRSQLSNLSIEQLIGFVQILKTDRRW